MRPRQNRSSATADLIDAAYRGRYKPADLWPRAVASSLTSQELSNMANTRSAKKATRVTARRTAINKNRLSRVRTSVRKVEEAIAAGDKAEAQAALKAAEPELVRGAQKGVVHRNAASRKVSRLARRVAKLA